jgi:CubicO group peptidase (beta-lactamase class C family)
MPSVSAVVFRGDEPMWQEALGLADVEARTEAMPDTQYRIGSITKTFTAVCILQLRAAGELSLDDPLTRFLPESAHGPTIGRMLAHSSGLQREPPGEIWETMRAPSREELLTGTADAEQVLEPGSWWHYSNLAYALLGEVVARADGATWEEALQARVLDPLGLARTTPSGAAPAARGYFVEPYSDAVRLEPDPDLGGAGALGKLWSTTGDLARWGAFLAAGDERVLAASTLEEMAHVRAMVDHAGWRLAWGTGLELYRSGDHVFVGHGGAMPGHLAGLVVNRKTKIGAAVLTNTGAGASPEKLALELAVAAIEALPQVVDAWQPGEPAPPEIEPLLGPWWVEGSEIVLAWRKGRLEAKLLDGPPGRETSYFEPEGEDRYRSVEGRERGELLRVVRDAEGGIEKLYFATYPLRREPSTF